jgi:hypothetical protein
MYKFNNISIYNNAAYISSDGRNSWVRNIIFLL